MQRFQPIPSFEDLQRMNEDEEALETDRSEKSQLGDTLPDVNLRGTTRNLKAMHVTDPYQAEVGLMKAYNQTLKRRKQAAALAPMQQQRKSAAVPSLEKKSAKEWVPYAAKKMSENTATKAIHERQTNISKVISEVRALQSHPHKTVDTAYGGSQRGTVQLIPFPSPSRHSMS